MKINGEICNDNHFIPHGETSLLNNSKKRRRTNIVSHVEINGKIFLS